MTSIRHFGTKCPLGLFSGSKEALTLTPARKPYPIQCAWARLLLPHVTRALQIEEDRDRLGARRCIILELLRLASWAIVMKIEQIKKKSMQLWLSRNECLECADNGSGAYTRIPAREVQKSPEPYISHKMSDTSAFIEQYFAPPC